MLSLKRGVKILRGCRVCVSEDKCNEDVFSATLEPAERPTTTHDLNTAALAYSSSLPFGIFTTSACNPEYFFPAISYFYLKMCHCFVTVSVIVERAG